MKLNTIGKMLLSTALVVSSISNAAACTVLSIRDAKGNVYQGRTNEFAGELPDRLTYWPAGTRMESVTPNGEQGKSFTTKYAIFGVTLKGITAHAKQETIHEAVNDQGMSFTTNAYTNNLPPNVNAAAEKVLSVMDLGAWALGNFENVAQVKQALENNEVAVWLPRLPSLGNFPAPIHFALYDKTGGAIVIEFTDGKTNVYDNPVGVMTNSPPFPWHVQNMDNYAYLTNVDKNSGKFNSLKVTAIDSGDNMAGLPGIETSAGRFVKAAYCSNFAHKAKTPDQALITLSHVMNNFDRPKNISIDEPGTASKAEAFAAKRVTSEDTYFTVMNDLSRNHFYIRTIDSINFTKFDLRKLAELKTTKVVTFDALNANTSLDGTDLFLK
jgi:penicillin V acylase-like amidase (Ntn superfamily)